MIPHGWLSLQSLGLPRSPTPPYGSANRNHSDGKHALSSVTFLLEATRAGWFPVSLIMPMCNYLSIHVASLCKISL
jgi:hypothetical protein